MMPDTVMSAATNSNETPIYQVMILQFMSFLIDGAKLFPANAFINTIIIIFALIISIEMNLP